MEEEGREEHFLFYYDVYSCDHLVTVCLCDCLLHDM